MRPLILEILLVSAAFATATLLILDLANGGPAACNSAAVGANRPLAGPTELDAALRDLTAEGWIPFPGGRALCVGPDPGPAAAAVRLLGFHDAVGAAATACCGLPFGSESFDFVLSAGLERARVPARVVLEMERVLRPGRVAVMLRLLPSSTRLDGLMKAAAPVATLLRFSDVVGARTVNGSAMVVFKKRGASGDGAPCEDAITKIPLLSIGIIEFMQAAIVSVVGWLSDG